RWRSNAEFRVRSCVRKQQATLCSGRYAAACIAASVITRSKLNTPVGIRAAVDAERYRRGAAYGRRGRWRSDNREWVAERSGGIERVAGGVFGGIRPGGGEGSHKT